MNRKLIAKSNYVLRKILNQEKNIDILQDLVESILQIKVKQVVLHPYLKNLSHYLPSEENFGIADMRVITEEEKKINIGLQFIDGYYIQNKLLLYYAQIHANQLEYTDQKEVSRTVTINFLNFDCFSSKEFHKIIKIKENSQKGEITEDLELHTIELSKFRKNKNKIENKEDAWIAYLEGSNQELIENAMRQEKNIKKIDQLLEVYWKEEKME